MALNFKEGLSPSTNLAKEYLFFKLLLLSKKMIDRYASTSPKASKILEKSP